MRTDFKHLRIQQLNRTLEPFLLARSAIRPERGWLRALRRALGISSLALAKQMGTSPQSVLQLEQSEAKDAITLKSLRSAARALNCELVYAIVPLEGSLSDLHERRLHQAAEAKVLRVEHTMALEDQASGHTEEAIQLEMKRMRGSRRNQP